MPCCGPRRPQVGLHRQPDGSIDTSSFKIIYVAPMKVLLQYLYAVPHCGLWFVRLC